MCSFRWDLERRCAATGIKVDLLLHLLNPCRGYQPHRRGILEEPSRFLSLCCKRGVLSFEVLLLHAHHGNNVCTWQTQKKGAMNSPAHTSFLAAEHVSSPSDQLLSPRRPLRKRCRKRMQMEREGRLGFITEGTAPFGRRGFLRPWRCSARSSSGWS